MTAAQTPTEKKYFTVAQANAMLPLVGAIVRDVTELAHSLRDRHERLGGVNPASLDEARREELLQIQDEMEEEQDRMHDYMRELQQLGVELKDFFVGLIDFPCWMDGREVYLCWRLGEPDVAHWHELNAGFSGRQKLLATQSH